MRAASLLLGCAALLAGCKVGPNYKPDRPPIPAVFAEHPATQAEIARTHAEARAWWATFQDPTLDALVEQAIANNLDLRAQAERITEARAMRNEERAALYPQLSLQGMAADQSYSTTLEFPPLPGVSNFNRDWQGGATLNWELDVFGRIRRSVEAADATVAASIEQRRGVLLTVLAELADQYATLRASQARLAIAENNLRIAQDALNLVNRLYLQGVGSNLQVAQQQAELDSVRATLAPFHTAIERSIHAIGVLTGNLPERYMIPLASSGPLPPIPALPASLPSEVLANRPDIRVAERRYAGAVARIGVAVAQLYPDFSLPLYAFPQSSAVHELLQSASLAWQIGIKASMPIFTGGRLSNQIVAARAAAEEARLSYEQTVLTAFQEVEDALVAYQQDSVRQTSLVEAEQASRLAYQRASTLYAHGLTGFLDVLSTERSVFSADDAVALSSFARVEDAVQLFRAIGAGWQGVDFANRTIPVSPALEAQAAAAARARDPALRKALAR